MLFVVARGWGFLVIGYLILAVLGVNLLVDVVFGPGTWSSGPWPPVAIVVAGLLTFITGRRMNRNGPVPLLRRPEGTPFKPRLAFLFAEHSFVFIPMEAWGVFEIGVIAVMAIRSTLQI